MHANFQELLNLRDAAPLDAKIAQHVAQCPECTLELERLHDLKAALRGLPQLPPPNHVWRAITDDIERAPPRVGNRYLAIGAATLLIAGTLVLIQIRYSNRGTDVAADFASPDADGQRLQQLETRSQQLEDLLQRLPPRPSVERAATSAAIDDLLDTHPGPGSAARYHLQRQSRAQSGAAPVERTRAAAPLSHQCALRRSAARCRGSHELSIQWSHMMNIATIFQVALLSVLITPAYATESPAGKTSPDQIEQQMQKAQERLEQAAREIAELSAKLTTEHLGDLQIYGNAGPRATLGMRVRPTANGSTDEATGVQIVSVSPGGPADLAGLKASDVIIAFGDNALRGDAHLSAQQQLVTLTQEARTDTPVTIEFKRDGKSQKAQVTPKPVLAYFRGPTPPPLPDLSGSLERIESYVRGARPQRPGIGRIAGANARTRRVFRHHQGLAGGTRAAR